MEKYNPQEIEKKWQAKWETENNWAAEDFSKKPKFYNLVEFPYPSGSGLHVGHCMGYTATDAFARMKRMQGYNVLSPIGWDAFGLPTENFAIKTGKKPQAVTKENTDFFRKQMKSLGYSFDWAREINTTDPEYYRWTQWIFLQFYKHGYVDGKLVEIADDDRVTPRLAYQAEMPINWCPSCKIGLANEEVIDGKCERCGTETYKKMQKQWMLRITAYADRLIEDLAKTDYLEKIKTQQTNWIGKSKGTVIQFKIKNLEFKKSDGKVSASLDPSATPQDDKKMWAQYDKKRSSQDDGKIASSPSASRNDTIEGMNASSSHDDYIEVFTTRADTLFGCTYVVLSPEHSLIDNLKSQISNLKEVEEYIAEAKKKSDLERTELQKEKTGVKLEGIKAINPINGDEVDVWVADYVLANYGTGAVMAVPAHDERDFEFAKKYGIEIKQVIAPLFTTENGDDAFRPNEEVFHRNTIGAIIKHWKEDKIYVLDWEKFGWKSFVIGGIEKGEDAVEAAIRETKEETGYQNIKNAKEVGSLVFSRYYATHKNRNSQTKSHCVLIELGGEEFVQPDPEEVKNHKGMWIDSAKVEEFINLKNHIFHWKENKTICTGENTPGFAFTDYGVMMNSGEFDGLTSEEGKVKITEKLKKMGAGDFTTNFKLRDWVFSRQHYWGEPIPIIYCRKCWENSNLKSQISKLRNNISIIDGKECLMIPMKEEDLPLTLPDVEKYEPTNTGESPLSAIDDWVNVKCPVCGGAANRETDTMPNWAGSSWYYLAYAMRENSKFEIRNSKGNENFEFNAALDSSLRPKGSPSGLGMTSEEKISSGMTEGKKPLGENIFDKNKKELEYWMPVDLYNGGMEHTNLHLLYSRFWHKFLYDLGKVSTPEPYNKRIAHGIILGSDNQKMSKSKGNVVNPDEMVEKYGADTLRIYIMFIGPYDQESAWSTAGLQGVYRFLHRVWNNQTKVSDCEDEKEFLGALHKRIEAISDDLENFRLNTYIAKLMEINNEIDKLAKISRQSFEIFLKLLSPAAPHIAEEIWYELGNKESISRQDWPKADEKYLVDEFINISVQINGKVRGVIRISPNAGELEAKELAKADEAIAKWIDGKEIVKTIYIPRRVFSLVVK